MKAHGSKNRWKGLFLRLLLGVFFVWLLFFDSSSIRKMIDLRKKSLIMKAKYEQQASLNDSIRTLNKKKETDPAEWEKEARASGMQKPGDQVIRVIKGK
jgi:cell division protein FtsB